MGHAVTQELRRCRRAQNTDTAEPMQLDGRLKHIITPSLISSSRSFTWQKF